MNTLVIRPIQPEDQSEWLRMRQALWPNHTAEEFAAQSEQILNDSMRPVFVAERSNGKLGAFLEAGTRKYAEGCETSPTRRCRADHE